MASFIISTVYSYSSLFTVILMWVLLALFGSTVYACNITASDEVNALRDIAKELGKKDWNFKEDPCDRSMNYSSWFSKGKPDKQTYVNQVTCTCIEDKFHLINMSLKGQDLAGTLPKSLAKLPYLTTIDVSRNLLNGTIPREWTTMKLEYMSLIVNQLSGKIPKYLGKITTLQYLSIESNSFSGAVPAEIGRLVNLRNLTLSDNYLTGQLPIELKNLTNLTELRLSSNNFTGQIPNYFQSWKQLQKLEIQGSGFDGPIPSSISLLTNLIELRISDLNGEISKFPSLEGLTGMARLMLRNCRLSGSIPHYISGMTGLKILDLSFNNLNGSIPKELQFLNHLQDLYLTNNMLSGPIPTWLRNKDDNSHIDLSYNNFDARSAQSSCNKQTLNLYRSFSEKQNLRSSICMKDFHCKARYLLHINCGGKETTIGNTVYEKDDESGGAANFVARRAEWGFSSTGNFWFNKNSHDYIARNSSTLRLNDSELYTEARISATSLTYYGNCLGKGNYTVILHFSEIVFAENSSASLGRRIFNIYIQEKLVYKDFNIRKETNATNKVVNKVFPRIPVIDTIEIRFYFAGKGSTGIPVRGTYGPLISAISVESEFKPPADREKPPADREKPPADREKITRIVLGVASILLFLIIIAIALFWRKYYLKNNRSREQELAEFDLQAGFFTFRQIKAATDNFNIDNKLGEGGFGSVYLGTLLDGTHIAVKKLSSRSSQGNREFVNELGMISGLQHPNLVRLYGCCVEGSQLFLVYEYMENNNLALSLFENDELKLDWPTRMRICIDVARGLTFLHEESTIKIVHRDIKATNILLDKDLSAKISDFGLAKLGEEDKTHISTRVAGTIGYMAPEYALWGYLTYKADVYSFGVVALEMVAGRSNTKFQPDENYFSLLDWAFALQQQKGNLMELVDPRLVDYFNKEEVLKTIRIALLCTNPSPAVRPTMSEVLSMLEGNMVIKELTLEPSAYSGDWLYQASRQRYNDLSSDSETQNLVRYREVLRDDSFQESVC